MKEILIVGNWKMNPQDSIEAENLFQGIKNGIKLRKNKDSFQNKKVEVVICPPFIYLSDLRNLIYSSDLKLGAQNCFWEEKGAFTGEISPLQLKNLEVKYIILGHSERRKYLEENDEIITKKLKAVLEVRLSPILCIGETREEKIAERTAEILKYQLENALKEAINCKKLQANKLIIAYEPVWAIGTGNFCQQDEALSNLLFIKKQLLKLFPKNLAEKIKILYGGSVDSKNAKNYIDVGFDGLLVGGASLKAGEFVKIVKTISTACE